LKWRLPLRGWLSPLLPLPWSLVTCSIHLLLLHLLLLHLLLLHLLLLHLLLL
jgi:hypothetical protein